MGATKPTVQMDWINDDAASKYTAPGAPDQLAGHISGTNADPKIFNWAWWRMSQWIEFLDNTFDANGNEVNAPNSTKITETVAPAASTITLDSGGIKGWDGSSNNSFSVTEAGAIQIGYAANNIITSSGGVTVVCTATSADLVKLHAITPSAADLNIMLGASSNGLIVADITKLANIDASAAEINILDGVTIGTTELNFLSASGLAASDFTKLAAIDATAAEIDILDGATLSTAELNLLDGVTCTTAEINYLDTPGLVAADFTKLAAITATSAELNILDGCTCTYSELNILDGCTCTTAELNILDGCTTTYDKLNYLNAAGLVAADLVKLADITVSAAQINSGSAGILGDGTAGRIAKIFLVEIADGTNPDTIKVTITNRWNGDTISTTDNIGKSSTVGNFSLSALGDALTILNTGLSGDFVGGFGFCSSTSFSAKLHLVDIVYNASGMVLSVSASDAVSVDMTSDVDTGGFTFTIVYLTSA